MKKINLKNQKTNITNKKANISTNKSSEIKLWCFLFPFGIMLNSESGRKRENYGKIIF